jgi:melibiose permease
MIRGGLGGCMDKKVPKGFKVIYGLNAYSNGLLMGCIGSYLMFYFTDIALIPIAFVGALFFFCKILNAVASPVVGILIDKNNSKYGKLKPWLFWGTIIASISVVLIFRTPEVPQNFKLVYVVILYIVWGLSVVIYGTAYSSVFPTLTRDMEERNKLSIIPAIGGVLGDFTSVGVVIPLVSIIAATQAEGFFRLVLIFAALFFIFSMIFIKFYRENIPKASGERISYRDMLTTVIKNDQFLVILLVTFFMNIGIYITTGTALYFFKYNLNNEGLYASFGITVGLSQVLVMTQFPRIMKKLSKKAAFLVAGIIIVLAYIILFFARNIALTFLPIVFIGGILLYFGLGITGSIMPIFIADVIDYGEWKHKERNSSTIISVNNLVGTFSDALIGLIITTTLAFIGFAPNSVQSEKTLTGLAFLLTGIPMILVFIAVLIFTKFYKLNNEYYNQIKNELENSEK